MRENKDRLVYASIPHLNLFILFYVKEFNFGGKVRRHMEMDTKAGDKTEVSVCREGEGEEKQRGGKSETEGGKAGRKRKN